MLTRVQVVSRRGSLLNLPLEDVDNGLIVAEIEGLDPVKATLVSSSVASRDGEQFQSAKREKRNLKFKIELEPDWANSTTQSLRQRLYEFFMPESDTTLRFYDSLGTYTTIDGTVEEFDCPLFTPDPVADISLVCFDPDFLDPNPSTASGVSSPFAQNVTQINYLGTVDTGIKLVVTPTANTSSISIFHTRPDGQSVQADLLYSFLAGDEITFSSVPGAKGATLKRAGVVSSITGALSPQSNWIALQPGTNKIRVATGFAGHPYTVTYTNRYGGL